MSYSNIDKNYTKGSTVKSQTTPAGVPFLTPNVVVKEDANWHVSYNNVDAGIYGCDTTAIVVNNWDFYILNGNHVASLKFLDNLAEAIDYFFSKPDQHNKLTVYGSNLCLSQEN